MGGGGAVGAFAGKPVVLMQPTGVCLRFLTGLLVCCMSYVTCRLVIPLLSAFVSDSTLELVLDAEVSAGSRLEAYFNSDWAHPSAASLQPGLRAAYRLRYKPRVFSRATKLEHVRLDITDSPETSVRVFALQVRAAGKLVWQISGDQFASVGRSSGIANVVTDGPTIRFVTSNHDPMFAFSPNVTIAGAGFLSDAVVFLQDNLAAVVVIAALLSICVFELFRPGLSGCKRFARSILPLVPTVGLPLVFISVTQRYLATNPHYQSVDLAVGSAAFSGYAKVAEFRVLYMLILTSVLVGLFVGFLGRSIASPVHTREGVETLQPATRIWNVLQALAVCIVLILVSAGLVPDAISSFSSLGDAPNVLDYDSLNIETWNYLYQLGFKPFADYWFPYGLSSFVMGRTPSAVWMMYCHSLLLYLVFALSLYVVLGRTWSWSLSTVVLIAALDIGGYLRGTYRYFIAMDVVLSFAAISFLERGRLAGALFGLFAAYAFCFEASQVLYALPGVAIIAGLTLFEAFQRRRHFSLLERWAIAVCLAGIAVAGVAVSMLFSGQLTSLIRLYSRLGSSAVSSSIPGDMIVWLEHPMSPEGFVLWAPLLMLAFSTAVVMSSRCGRTRSLAMVTAGLCLTMCAIFCKHLVRPHMALQFIGPVVLTACVVLYGTHFSLARSQRVVMAIALGALVAAFRVDDFAYGLYKRALSAPQRAGDGLAMLVASREEEQSAYRYFFSRERLSHAYPVIRILEGVLRDLRQDEGKAPSFFVLGDEAFLYNVFRQTPPPFISLYNSSDVRDQRDIVTWLERVRPEVVIWNSRSQMFDGVPNLVRVPLLFSYVVQNYGAFKAQEGFLFLRRIGDQRDGYLEWRAILGDTVDLGAIPGLSAIGSKPKCQLGEDNPSCIPVLKVGCKGNSFRAGARVRLATEGSLMDLTFNPVPGRTYYYVRLDRMWFWPRNAGRGWRVDLGQDRLCASVVGRTLPDELLY